MKKQWIFTPLLVLVLTFPAVTLAEDDEADEPWFTSLETDTPQEGFELAVTLSRRAVKTTQPDMEVLREGREEYSNDPESLIATSQVVATHFQTIAAANNYWRD